MEIMNTLAQNANYAYTNYIQPAYSNTSEFFYNHPGMIATVATNATFLAATYFVNPVDFYMKLGVGGSLALAFATKLTTSALVEYNYITDTTKAYVDLVMGTPIFGACYNIFAEPLAFLNLPYLPGSGSVIAKSLALGLFPMTAVTTLDMTDKFLMSKYHPEKYKFDFNKEGIQSLKVSVDFFAGQMLKNMIVPAKYDSVSAALQTYAAGAANYATKALINSYDVLFSKDASYETVKSGMIDIVNKGLLGGANLSSYYLTGFFYDAIIVKPFDLTPMHEPFTYMPFSGAIESAEMYIDNNIKGSVIEGYENSAYDYVATKLVDSYEYLTGHNA